jgi:hypothetical protein
MFGKIAEDEEEKSTLRKRTKLAIVLIAIALVAILGLSIFQLQQSSKKTLEVYSFIKPENATILSVQNPVIPENESYVIASAEQACMSENNKAVNVTVIKVQNETQAPILVEALESTFLAQGFSATNLTSPYPAIELLNAERPTIILLQKGNYVSLCQSEDANLALEAANAQLNR